MQEGKTVRNESNPFRYNRNRRENCKADACNPNYDEKQNFHKMIFFLPLILKNIKKSNIKAPKFSVCET